MRTRYKKLKQFNRDEHRVLMENFLGRRLTFNEVVHHKDGNIHNNSLDNLEIISRSEHGRQHRLGSKLSEETKAKIRSANLGRIPSTRKFSDKEILQIRCEWAFWDKSLRAFGRKWDIFHGCIADIINYKTYTNI